MAPSQRLRAAARGVPVVTGTDNASLTIRSGAYRTAATSD